LKLKDLEWKRLAIIILFFIIQIHQIQADQLHENISLKENYSIENLKAGNYLIFISNNSYISNEKFPLMHFTHQEMRIIEENYNKASRVPTKIDFRPPNYSPSPYPAKGKRFDLLEYFPNFPDERMQGCGDCWVWALTGAMEIDRAVHTGIKERLSVQWFNSNFGRPCCGGYATTFADFFGRPIFGKHYAVFWSNTNAYYHEEHKGEDCLSSVPPEKISKEPYYPIVHCEAQVIPTIGVGKDKAIANIKDVLNQKRAVVLSIYMNNPAEWERFYEFWATKGESAVWKFGENGESSVPTSDESANRAVSNMLHGHNVLCVGYDDTNPTNRYWIMVNSWQNKPTPNSPNLNRPNNIFYVSMDMDYDSVKPHGVYADYNDSSIYTRNFQWWTLKVETTGDGIGFFQNSQSGSKFKLDSDINGKIDNEISYGKIGDKPIVGDWDDDGLDGIGYFRPSDQTFYFDNNLDGLDDMLSIRYGKSADIPISGKWKMPFRTLSRSHHKEGIGYYRQLDNTFHLDCNLDGKDDWTITYGRSDSVPLSGDWDGDGYDGIGYYNRSDFTFHLDNNLDGKDEKTLKYLVMYDKLPNSPYPDESKNMQSNSEKIGLHTAYESGSGFDPDITGPMQKPLVGDWNVDGKDEVGIVLPEYRWKMVTSQYYRKIDYLCFYLNDGAFVYCRDSPIISAYPFSGKWS